MITIKIEEVAKRLNISKASVKNWEKHGYIKRVGGDRYSEDEIDILMERINSGEIKRLGSRANKSRSKHRFIPVEYLNSESSRDELEHIVDFILEYNIRPQQALFLLSINQLNRDGEIIGDLYEAIKFESSETFRREEVFLELKEWYEEIRSGEIKESNRFCKFLLESPLPKERDILGVIYQSIIFEGDKSTLGAYYTPTSVVKEMVENHNDRLEKVLDPCCGTGQFLLELARRIKNPEAIWGCDIDPVAVRITKINLFSYYFDINFKPNVFSMDSLSYWREDNFSFIVTNPPWGSKIDKLTLKELKKRYPMVESKESFSFFLAFAQKFLQKDGSYSFLLPESLLYVKNHRDIREFLLTNTTLTYIESYGKMFKRVFSSVIRLDGLKKLSPLTHLLAVKNVKDIYNIPQSRFLENINSNIDIYCSLVDQELIDRVYNHEHKTLKDHSRWALGVVTGNNSKFLNNTPGDGLEPVFRGKDIIPMKLNEPESFISFTPEIFQQCAPTEMYRAEEKLIYKFISKDLVFAYDNQAHLSLNSANILIPEIEELDIKSVAALLNSSIIRFIFRKKFNAIKVLRGDIESLPLPLLTPKQQVELEQVIDEYLSDKSTFDEIDDYIFNIFNFNSDEMEYITNFLN